MSSFIVDLAANRQKFLDGVDANRGDINLDIFADFYPDQAHFIFELLQNAEDVGATEATFELGPTECIFEHNGTRQLSEDDVRAITGIHNSTKTKSEDKIGKFGVGFKSVFVYTQSPSIHSEDFSFKIERLVMPVAIPADPEIGKKTRFTLPLDHPEKPADIAFREVEGGLSELAETTLLFLSNLQVVRWKVRGEKETVIHRLEHGPNHVEITKRSANGPSSSSHFLQFSEPVAGMKSQKISIAFPLDRLANAPNFDGTSPLGKRLKIVAPNRGRVAVFFPAEKETSGLRFHIHAPFVPELSRASIKETAANQPLFDQLAKLAGDCLEAIREQELLTPDFLNVLPNPQDEIPPRYQPIRVAIFEALNTRALTPTYAKSHAPARDLLQAGTALKELLSPADLGFLVDHGSSVPGWSAAGPRGSNAERLLAGLAMRTLDVSGFIDALSVKSVLGAPFTDWIGKKSLEWHQQLYLVLFSELPTNHPYKRSQLITRLRPLRIVRLGDEAYAGAGECFFPTSVALGDDLHRRVARGVYTSGTNKQQKDDARKFLEEIGVREVEDADDVQAILELRYTRGGLKPDLNDLKRFVELVEKDASQAELFADYLIFQQEDGKWTVPRSAYLDSPLRDTGLAVFFSALGAASPARPMSASYLNAPVALDKLMRFAEKTGVRAALEFELTTCYGNSAVADLVYNSPGKRTAQSVDRDYTIPGLSDLLANGVDDLSRLVWNTACAQKSIHWLHAEYRNNASYNSRTAPSQIICLLRDSSWIPQIGGSHVVPSKAKRGLLPPGFPVDETLGWLKAIRFGEEEQLLSATAQQKHATAVTLGFSDLESLEFAKDLAALVPASERAQLLALVRSRSANTFPERIPQTPEHRAKQVAIHAHDAPARNHEPRTRSVAVGNADVKQSAREYLRDQYTEGGVTFCQICKAALPFTLDDGSYFFEAVELLPQLNKWHYQNYLALCPNHSAMFEHANGSEGSLLDAVLQIEGNELPLLLARQESAVYFTRMHVADLKALILADRDVHQEVKSS